MACRDLEKGRVAAARIVAEDIAGTLDVMVLDLADLASVRSFSGAFHVRFDRLDLLINNAGVMWPPASKTANAFELQFGTNHLGHFALTARLLDLLRRTSRSRVVTVSSVSHRFGTIDFDDLHWESRPYRPNRAYGQSKLANLLFAYELQRRLDLARIETISVAAHPGYTSTDLQRYSGVHRLSLLSHGISNLGGLNLLCLLEWFCHKSFKTQEIQAVAHHNTVFGQFLALLPRHEFDAESREHQRGQRLRVMSRWAQFVALGLGQVTGRQSLRDIVANLQVQSSKLYHLGVRTVSRSSLARVNAEQPYTLYEAVFSRLLSRCQQQAPGHRFRFKHKLYAVDASTIDLCLALFPWATFRRTKAAVKLHVGLDQAGQLPSFVSLTEGKRGDVTVARTWRFPAGSVVVADRAYLDFKWLHQLQTRSVTFVTRLKRGVRYRVTHEHDFRPETGVLADQRIELTSARSGKAYPDPLRRVVYRDPQTKNRYVFVTNNTTWVAKTIADIYKSRWQIELFFKWIKQHLKVKRFIGRSKNAVWTQLWIATCMYLLLAYLKFVLRLRWSLNQMLQVLQLNIFERRPLHELFTTHAPPDPDRPQLALAWT